MECLLPHSRTRTPISADGCLCVHLGSAASKSLMCPGHILEAMLNNSQILCWMGRSVHMRQVTMKMGTQLHFKYHYLTSIFFLLFKEAFHQQSLYFVSFLQITSLTAHTYTMQFIFLLSRSRLDKLQRVSVSRAGRSLEAASSLRGITYCTTQ